MIRLAIVILAFVVYLNLPTIADAQQAQPDVAALQKAIAVLQQQRNNAMDQAAGAQVELQRVTEENAKLKADLVEALKKPADHK